MEFYQNVHDELRLFSREGGEGEFNIGNSRPDCLHLSAVKLTRFIINSPAGLYRTLQLFSGEKGAI